jgi:hypothetical protein
MWNINAFAYPAAFTPELSGATRLMDRIWCGPRHRREANPRQGVRDTGASLRYQQYLQNPNFINPNSVANLTGQDFSASPRGRREVFAAWVDSSSPHSSPARVLAKLSVWGRSPTCPVQRRRRGRSGTCPIAFAATFSSARICGRSCQYRHAARHPLHADTE